MHDDTQRMPIYFGYLHSSDGKESGSDGKEGAKDNCDAPNLAPMAFHVSLDQVFTI